MKTNGMADERLLRKRAFLYLGFMCGFLFVGWLYSIIFLDSSGSSFYGGPLLLFSFFPLLSSVLTRMITKDKSSWLLRPHFRKNWKTYLAAGFVPGFLIFLGAVLYFSIFPHHLDVSAKRLIETYGRFGVPSDLPHTVNSIIRIGLVGVLVSPFALPIVLFGLGEELGWRGYFLPILLKLMDQQKAVLLTGLLWGLCHAPLIYFGLNYGSNYWGAPYSGIVMMTLVGVVLNAWLSYVTIKTESIIPAGILHGAVNLIGEFPAMAATAEINPLLGPNPTGIIGMSLLLLGAVVVSRMMAEQTEELIVSTNI